MSDIICRIRRIILAADLSFPAIVNIHIVRNSHEKSACIFDEAAAMDAGRKSCAHRTPGNRISFRTANSCGSVHLLLTLTSRADLRPHVD